MSEALRLQVWKSLSKGNRFRLQKWAQVLAVVNVSSVLAGTCPQLQMKQVELISFSSHISLHPHGGEEKNSLAGNPAFAFAHRADKTSCHPFSQQEK